ncbi:uncharacterized protein SOCEGT47_031960 [Sorangium cellulosum]|uniref:Uncharacterized protein n=1 Tax=Sorangium cellulosum TaxID=56 RepID=A0A4P2Q0K6_SORCE|nr:hypothetical protein [Sorangium cellulosum]AUX22690.1 uncharacterized protein SOCEGT47_031960 [Sorangium cellulosum]
MELGQHLGQRHQVAERARALGPRPFLAIGELLDPVQHPDRDRVPAHGAGEGARPRLRRREHDIAFAVAVEVVFPLFREELHGAAEALSGLQGAPDREVIERRVEGRGLAAELAGRVRVRAGDEPVAIEPGDAPVHRGIGREPRLDREDVRREIAIALLDRVEAGLGAQHREPGGPDVRRHEVGALARLQHDLEQVARVEPQDRPPVGAQVADLRERADDAIGGLEVGRIEEMMDLPRPVSLLVDRGDLHRQDEAGRPAARPGEPLRDGAGEVVPQAEQPGLGRYEALPELGHPCGVGEVPRADHRDALALSPVTEMREIAIAARRAGVLRMHVEIGVEAHVVGRGSYRELPRGVNRRFRRSSRNLAGKFDAPNVKTLDAKKVM